MLSSTLYDTKELKLIYESLYSQAENAKELFYKASSVGPLTDSSRIDYLQKQYDSAYRKLSETESEISRREH